MPRDDLIFDVGLHQAEDTKLYLAKGFTVVAVEAMPELAERAASELAGYVHSGQLVIENVAIAEATGTVPFFVNTASEWGTIRPEWAQRNERLGSPTSTSLTVRAVRFGDLLQRHGVPYFLKIDIEGADLLCIEALDPTDAPRFLSIESNKVSWDALVHEFDVLTALGYRRFKVVAQHKVPRQRPPYPAREGMYAPWHLQFRSSGLFGEEAPGRWLTRAQALAKYRLIFARYRLYGDNGLLPRHGLGKLLRTPVRLAAGSAGWFDTHARR